MPRPGFNFLVCPDPELIKLEVEELLAEHGGPSAFEKRVYYEPLPETFWQDLDVPSLLGGTRMLVLRRAQKMNAEFWKAMESRLRRFNDSAWPVFCLEGDWKKDKKGLQPAVPKVVKDRSFWKVVEDRKWLWKSPGLDPRNLRAFVGERARRRGLKVSNPTAEKLARILPAEAGPALREIEKLELLAGEDREIRDEHLAAVSAKAEMDIFAFLNAAVSGRRSKEVWTRVFSDHEVSANDSIFFAFLSLLTREARVLAEISRDEKPSVYVPGPAMSQKRELAARLGPEGVAGLFDLAMHAEFSIKSGERTVEQAFESLVAGLSRFSG
jgi:DNA polymerase-3 subunit delta